MRPALESSAPGPWPASVAALEEEQLRLGGATPALWFPQVSSETLRLAGCFVCFPSRRASTQEEAIPEALEHRVGRPDDAGWAGAALLEAGRLVALATVRGEAMAAYDPGHLALREGPLLESAICALPRRPDVLLVNATGRDHPRKAGLALHLGARLNLPSVGVTNRLLVASGEWPDDRAASQRDFELHGEKVGVWLRVRRRVRPLAIHAAWRTDVPTALAIVQLALGKARTPEPIRLARRAAREARHREVQGSSPT